LFSTVGLSWSPFTTERTYFARGSPTWPATESMSALDSPQTNAPPPRAISMSYEKPVPRMSSPSRPYSRAASIAAFRFTTASGYSSRT